MNSMGGIVAEAPLVRSVLPTAVKRRIVELWATFHTLSQVREAISKEFGLSLQDVQLRSYDPSRSYSRLSPRLRQLYAEVRKTYVADAANVAIAHQAHRLRKLEAIVEKATQSKDYNAALKGLELAAKEMGGVLEGRTVVRHEGAVSHIHGTVEDARSEVAMRLATLLEGMGYAPPTAPQPVATTVDAVATPVAIPPTPQ